jgi:hypothetical protein
MAKNRPRSYFWARHFSPGDRELASLSADAREGLSYARELAEHALERRRSALSGLPLAPLTVAELASDNGYWKIKIRRQIKQARIELFGADLGDSAIFYRLKKRRERGLRSCAEPGCPRVIAALANGRRRYCPEHGSPAARVRRHRRAAEDGP